MDAVSALLMLVGAGFTLVASAGLHRFDSVFARIHAAGKSSTFGLGLILAGVALRLLEWGAAAKLTAVALLALTTIPAGVHLIARASWRAGTELIPGTVVDPYSREREELHRRHPDP